MGKSFRILSLDGGGSWALAQALALREIYGDVPGHEILKQFDLVASNSGGSIVLGGLIKGLTPNQIVQLFLDEPTRRLIFHDKFVAPFSRILGLGPRYSASAKLEGLRNVLGDLWQGKTLEDCAAAVETSNGRFTHFLVVSYDYDRERVRFFRSNKNSGSSSGGKNTSPGPSLAEIIHASSEAPINFFDDVAKVGDLRLWDGALSGFNNPSMAAVAEVLADSAATADNYAIRAEIGLLSIGTGNVHLAEPGSGAGDPALFLTKDKVWLKPEIKKAIGAILSEPPASATYMAHVMLEGRITRNSTVTDGPVVRLNPLVQPVRRQINDPWQFPQGISSDAFKRLKELDMDAVKQTEIDDVHDFAKAWIADRIPNQAIRANSRTLEPEIGHATFGTGKAAWLALAPPR